MCICMYMRLGFSKVIYKSRTSYLTSCDIKLVALYAYDVSKILGKTSEVIFFIFMYVLYVCMYVCMYVCTVHLVYGFYLNQHCTLYFLYFNNVYPGVSSPTK